MTHFLHDFWMTAWGLFSDLWYWILVGTVLAEVVTRFVPLEKVNSKLEKNNIGAIGLATVSGAFLPLCACGVIPFLVSFLRLGIPLSVIMAFTASSPLMDPADFAVTAGVLGMKWAVVKTLAALVMGCTVGSLVLIQNKRGAWLNQVKVRVATDAQDEVAVASESPTIGSQVQDFLGKLWFSGKFLLLAIVLGALLNTLVPANVVTKVLGGHHWFSIPLASLFGIITYGVSSAPIVKVLMSMGLTQGGGMAFLIAGHATSIGLLTTLYTLVKRPMFVAYLITTFVISLLFGYAFSFIH